MTHATPARRNALPQRRTRREAPRAAEAQEARFARAEQLRSIEARLERNAASGAPTRPRPWPRPGEPTPRRDAELALAEDRRKGAFGSTDGLVDKYRKGQAK